MDKLSEELKGQGINVSEDTLFIVSEIRKMGKEIRGEIKDSRNIMLAVFGVLFGVVIGLIIGFGIAILT